MNGYEASFTISDVNTSSLTPVDVPGMQFLMLENSVWRFKFLLKVGSSTAGGLKVAIVVPAGAAFQAWAIGSGPAISTLVVDPMTVSATLGASFCTQIAQNQYLSIEGGCLNGSTIGLLKLQAAKVTSGIATLNSRSILTIWPA